MNDEIHSLFLFSVHFIIQKLKNEHTFLKKYKTEKAEESLILTEREERKTQIFPTLRDSEKVKVFGCDCKRYSTSHKTNGMKNWDYFNSGSAQCNSGTFNIDALVTNHRL